MNRYEKPVFFTLLDGEQSQVILAWSPETARALGIRDQVKRNGRVYTTWRLDGPQEPHPMGGEIAARE